MQASNGTFCPHFNGHPSCCTKSLSFAQALLRDEMAAEVSGASAAVGHVPEAEVQLLAEANLVGKVPSWVNITALVHLLVAPPLGVKSMAHEVSLFDITA